MFFMNHKYMTIIVLCCVFCLFAVACSEAPDTTTTTTEELVVVTTTEKETTVPTTEAVDTMIDQFVSLGFTEEEAQEMKVIFETVGISEINNIQAVGDAGIDKLQAFKCGIYDSRVDKGGASLLFTVENRRICHISLNGFMNTMTMDYDSIVLYDIWNEDGTINEAAVGYKAVVDYENEKITKYEG